jgi:hypothetical protein
VNSVRTRVCVSGAEMELRDIRDGEVIRLLLEFKVEIECRDGSRKGDALMTEPDVDSGRF